MRHRLGFFFALLVTSLGGCASYNVVELKYQAPPTAAAEQPGPAPVSVGTFADRRGTSSNWVGAIRGGYGNPLKKLTTRNSTSETVQSAFADALKARNMLAPAGAAAFRVEGSISKFDCSYYWNREAHAHLVVNVVAVESRTTVFSKSYSTDNVEAGVGAGIFGDVDHLARFAQRTLNETIDKALSDPALLHALSQAPPAARRNAEASSERLRTLERLRKEGLVSEAEYEKKRREILQSL